MSHDHLQYDRLKLHRRGTNLNLVAKNLDEKMKIHDCWY